MIKSSCALECLPTRLFHWCVVFPFSAQVRTKCTRTHMCSFGNHWNASTGRALSCTGSKRKNGTPAAWMLCTWARTEFVHSEATYTGLTFFGDAKMKKKILSCRKTASAEVNAQNWPGHRQNCALGTERHLFQLLMSPGQWKRNWFCDITVVLKRCDGVNTLLQKLQLPFHALHLKWFWLRSVTYSGWSVNLLVSEIRQIRVHEIWEHNPNVCEKSMAKRLFFFFFLNLEQSCLSVKIRKPISPK